MVPRSRPFVIPSGGGHLSGVSARTGKRGIVLIHGSGSRGICVWLKELPWLAAVGGSSCPQPTDPLLEARIVNATSNGSAQNGSRSSPPPLGGRTHSI